MIEDIDYALDLLAQAGQAGSDEWNSLIALRKSMSDPNGKV